MITYTIPYQHPHLPYRYFWYDEIKEFLKQFEDKDISIELDYLDNGYDVHKVTGNLIEGYTILPKDFEFIKFTCEIGEENYDKVINLLKQLYIRESGSKNNESYNLQPKNTDQYDSIITQNSKMFQDINKIGNYVNKDMISSYQYNGIIGKSKIGNKDVKDVDIGNFKISDVENNSILYDNITNNIKLQKSGTNIGSNSLYRYGKVNNFYEKEIVNEEKRNNFGGTGYNGLTKQNNLWFSFPKKDITTIRFKTLVSDLDRNSIIITEVLKYTV